eukprot:649808_1
MFNRITRKVDEDDDDDDGKYCAICYQNFEVSKPRARLTVCSKEHSEVVCKPCLKATIELRGACPICNEQADMSKIVLCDDPEEKKSALVLDANDGGDNDSTFYVSHWQYQGFDPSEKPMDYLQDLDMKIEDAYQRRTKDTKEVELGSINGGSGFYIKFDYDDWMSGFQLRRDNNVVDRYPTSVRLVTRKTDDQYDEDTTTTSMRKIFEDTSLDQIEFGLFVVPKLPVSDIAEKIFVKDMLNCFIKDFVKEQYDEEFIREEIDEDDPFFVDSLVKCMGEDIKWKHDPDKLKKLFVEYIQALCSHNERELGIVRGKIDDLNRNSKECRCPQDIEDESSPDSSSTSLHAANMSRMLRKNGLNEIDFGKFLRCDKCNREVSHKTNLRLNKRFIRYLVVNNYSSKLNMHSKEIGNLIGLHNAMINYLLDLTSDDKDKTSKYRLTDGSNVMDKFTNYLLNLRRNRMNIPPGNCSICLVDMDPNIRPQHDEAVYELENCLHKFHRSCISRWFAMSLHRKRTIKPKCPLCRKKCSQKQLGELVDPKKDPELDDVKYNDDEQKRFEDRLIDEEQKRFEDRLVASMSNILRDRRYARYTISTANRPRNNDALKHEMQNNEKQESLLDHEGVATSDGWSIGITNIKKDKDDESKLEVTYVVDAPDDTKSVWVRFHADGRFSSEVYDDDEEETYRFQKKISVDLENNGREKIMFIKREDTDLDKYRTPDYLDYDTALDFSGFELETFICICDTKTCDTERVCIVKRWEYVNKGHKDKNLEYTMQPDNYQIDY